MIRVKVCGVTRAEDAALAAELGASAVGFIFWPGSPRAIEPMTARRIAAALPPFVVPVGVFVDASPEQIVSVAREVRLGAVQLHGDESPDEAVALGYPVIKAVSFGTEDDEFDRWGDVSLLVDAHDPARRGGTGQPVDWTRAARLAARRPIVLAGGLTPANVAHAIAQVRPAAVDVSSGVEASPGIKDHARLRSFFAAIAASTEARS